MRKESPRFKELLDGFAYEKRVGTLTTNILLKRYVTNNLFGRRCSSSWFLIHLNSSGWQEGEWIKAIEFGYTPSFGERSIWVVGIRAMFVL